MLKDLIHGTENISCIAETPNLNCGVSAPSGLGMANQTVNKNTATVMANVNQRISALCFAREERQHQRAKAGKNVTKLSGRMYGLSIAEKSKNQDLKIILLAG